METTTNGALLKLSKSRELIDAVQTSVEEHLAVFAAIKARDGEAADAAMRTHLTRQREALRQLARQHKSRIAVVNTEHDKLGIPT